MPPRTAPRGLAKRPEVRVPPPDYVGGWGPKGGREANSSNIEFGEFSIERTEDGRHNYDPPQFMSRDARSIWLSSNGLGKN